MQIYDCNTQLCQKFLMACIVTINILEKQIYNKLRTKISYYTPCDLYSHKNVQRIFEVFVRRGDIKNWHLEFYVTFLFVLNRS